MKCNTFVSKPFECYIGCVQILLFKKDLFDFMKHFLFWMYKAP